VIRISVAQVMFINWKCV